MDPIAPYVYLQAEMGKKSLTQRRLASLMGVAPSYLSLMMTGKRPINVYYSMLLELALDLPPLTIINVVTKFDVDKTQKNRQFQRAVARMEIKKLNIP